MVEDQNNFMTRIEDLKPYMIEFEEDSKMKPKIYPSCYTFKEVIDKQSLYSLIISVFSLPKIVFCKMVNLVD